MVTAVWIIYGAAIALRMAVFTRMAVSWQEGMVWAVVAVLLGALAYFKESSARKGSELAVTGLREQLIKLQGFSEGTASAMGRSLSRIGALPETTPKGEEIVDELKEGLKEFRENIKALAESTSRPQTAPVTPTRTQKIVGSVLIGLLVLALVMLTWGLLLVVKNVSDEFPNSLSPAQISDLAGRLRKEGLQKVMIVRKADPKSIALAEQFRRVFESAHWVLVTPPRPPNNGTTLLRGLVVWRAPNDYQALAFSRALYISGLPYETRTDIELTNSGYFELSISDGWFLP